MEVIYDVIWTYCKWMQMNLWHHPCSTKWSNYFSDKKTVSDIWHGHSIEKWWEMLLNQLLPTASQIIKSSEVIPSAVCLVGLLAKEHQVQHIKVFSRFEDLLRSLHLRSSNQPVLTSYCTMSYHVMIYQQKSKIHQNHSKSNTSKSSKYNQDEYVQNRWNSFKTRFQLKGLLLKNGVLGARA